MATDTSSTAMKRGIYLNKGDEGFARIRNSEYVDKSGLIDIVNKNAI